MAFVVQPSRNPMLNKAWSDYKREQRAEKKPKKEEPPPAPELHKKPAKSTKAAPDVHKKAGKVHTTAAKKGGRK